MTTFRICASLLVVASTAIGLNAHRASAQCLDWATGFEAPPAANGLNGPVYAMAIFDEDGPGGNPPSLFVGGRFTMAGSVAVNNIARWNGLTWSDVGGGVTGDTGYVLALHVGRATASAAPSLYVGGDFTSAGATAAANIARWNGVSWSALGTGTAGNGGLVRAICEYTPTGLGITMLYVGGDFTSAGGVTLNFIARWNGSTWSALGSTVGTSGGVFALTVYGGNLVVGGAFPTAGLLDPNTKFIAKWNGTAWSSFGTGMNSSVNALLVDGGFLYVGGTFTIANGVAANRVAKYDGSIVAGGFSALGTGTSDRVRALAAFDDECGHSIYAGGDFLTAGGVSVGFIGRWVTNPGTGGGAWKAAGLGTISTVRALRPYFFQNLSALFAGGEFTAAGGRPSFRIAKYIAQDQDGDGLYDCWETDVALGGGIDINCDGTVDLDLYTEGTRKDHKDIFVEFDAMTGLGPLPGPINKVIDAFAAAPVANPDGINGIKLHVDGDEFGLPPATWIAADGQWPPAFDTFKTDHFGTVAQQTSPNRANILAAKRLAYRYCVFAHNCQADKTSGMGEIGGNDFMVTLGTWDTVGGTDDQKSGCFMHELGHTLGLYHGGGQVGTRDERFNYKPNYRSIMNYIWQTPKPWMGTAWPLSGANLGYSVGSLRDLNETGLIETGLLAGMGGNPAVSVPVAAPTPPFPPFTVHPAPEGGPVDWDFDGFPGGTWAVDCNHIRPGTFASPGDTLKDHDDWHALKYNFRDSADYADGQHQDITTEELTQEIDNELAAMLPPIVACLGDVNGDHVVNIDDLVAVIIAWGAKGAPGSNPADLTRDGVVNIDDLVQVITHWGPCR